MRMTSYRCSPAPHPMGECSFMQQLAHSGMAALMNWYRLAHHRLAAALTVDTSVEHGFPQLIRRMLANAYDLSWV